MKFDEFLIALGLEHRLNLADTVQTGACSIEFDNELTVNIEHDTHSDVMQAYCVLGNAPATHRDAFFAMLLQAHLFGAATDDCMFGFEPRQDQVILFRTIALANTDGHTAIAQLEALINQAVRWRDDFSELIEAWEQNVVQAAVSVAQTVAARV